MGKLYCATTFASCLNAMNAIRSGSLTVSAIGVSLSASASLYLTPNSLTKYNDNDTSLILASIGIDTSNVAHSRFFHVTETNYASYFPNGCLLLVPDSFTG